MSMDFEEFSRRFEAEPTTHRPVEQRNIVQRIAEVWQIVVRLFWAFVILLIAFAVLGAFLRSWERAKYRQDLLEKNYLIEVDKYGREQAVKK